MEEESLIQTKHQPIKAEIQKIAKEAEEAGCNNWQIIKIIKELTKEEFKNIRELRNKTIELLKEVNPKAAEVYALFNRMDVYTSKEEIESFDMGNIIKSLLKETNIARVTAEKISAEVEDKIKDLNISYLTTSLIREMTNVKLLEYGHEAVHKEYTRLGLPVSDVTKKLEKNEELGREILREYTWSKLIPKKVRRMHFESDIFISEASDFVTKAYSYSFTPKIKEVETFEEATIEVIKQLNELKDHFSLIPSVNSVNVVLGQFLKNKSRKKLYENANFLIKQLNSILYKEISREKKPAIGLDFFLRKDLDEMRKSKEISVTFAEQFLKRHCEQKNNLNFVVKNCIDSKYRLKSIDKSILNSYDLEFLNCKNNEVYPLNGEMYSKSKGMSLYVGINLVKFVLSCRKSEAALFNLIKEKVSSLNSLKEVKQEILEKKSKFFPEEIKLSDLKPVIGLTSLNQASRLFLKEGAEKEIGVFSKKIVDEITKEIGSDWTITKFNDLEGLNKFIEFNKKEFDEILVHEPGIIHIRKYSNKKTANTLKEFDELMNQNAECIELLKGN